MKRGREILFLFLLASSLILLSPQAHSLKPSQEVSPITGNALKCFPSYECGSWSECTDGLRSRVCEDQGCGRRDIIERELCANEVRGCTPNVQCGSWSECIYIEKTNDIIKGAINFGGYRNRLCVDLNNCIDTFAEEGICEESYELQLNKLEECNQEFLVAVDPATQRQIAKIDLESWRAQKLNVVFSQGETQYCPSCYNGAKDSDEESVDCGGDCKACKEDKEFPLRTTIILTWLLSAIFSLLFIIELISSQKKHKKFSNRSF